MFVYDKVTVCHDFFFFLKNISWIGRLKVIILDKDFSKPLLSHLI